MLRFEYFKPASISEALDLMGRFSGDAAYIAGGTDVMVLLRQKRLSVKALTSLRSIKELSVLNGLSIGACVTHREIQKNEHAQKRLSALHDAVCNVGSTQIRNVATIGGNICNAAPSADTACPLLVLDAEGVIVGPEGERRVSLDDFFLGPGMTVLKRGEILKELRVPETDDYTGSAYIRQARRNAVDLPIAAVAVRLTLDRTDVRCKDMLCSMAPASEILSHFGDEEVRCKDIRIAMAAVAPRPLRARKAEDMLKGRVLSDEAVAAAAQVAASESSPIDDVRGDAWYRRELVEVLVRRAIMKSLDRVLRPDEMVYPDRLW